jgi:hypothetical protein
MKLSCELEIVLIVILYRVGVHDEDDTLNEDVS